MKAAYLVVLALKKLMLQLTMAFIVHGSGWNIFSHRSDGCATDVNVAGENIVMSPSIKSIGVVLDSQLSFDNHLAAVMNACYFHMCAPKTHPIFASRRSRENGCMQYYELATRLFQLTSRRDVGKQLC